VREGDPEPPAADGNHLKAVNENLFRRPDGGQIRILRIRSIRGLDEVRLRLGKDRGEHRVIVTGGGARVVRRGVHECRCEADWLVGGNITVLNHIGDLNRAECDGESVSLAFYLQHSTHDSARGE
jgi:hypothetical protein